MATFLFWNLQNKPLCGFVADLAIRHQVDVLLLAECGMLPAELLSALNRVDSSAYHYAPGNCTRIQVFTRFPRDFLTPVLEDDRLTVRHLQLPGLTDILVAAIHFPSKLFWRDASQALECVPLALSIRQAEGQVSHTRTVLVGDLNMNPYEDGVLGATGLHAVMCRSIARRRQRQVQGRTYSFFYNPMWSFLGDLSAGPPGTYYHWSSEQIDSFWNMFDQVLVRPDLLDSFVSVEILHSVGNVSLLSRSGVPDTGVASDHLPVLFTLAL